jgi:hypothetical protein
VNLYFDQVAGKDWVMRTLNSAGHPVRKVFFVPKWNKRVPAKCKNAANDDHEKQTKYHAAGQKRKIHFV